MDRFDRLAKTWDLNPRRVESARRTTQRIRSLIPLHEAYILDYGSGTGLIAFGLADLARRIDAMDRSEKMLEALKKKVEESGYTQIVPIRHDIEKEPLPPARYDLVVTAMTLHHIEDPDLFVQKALQALKPGGYLAISDLEREDGTFHTHGNEGVRHFGFDPADIEALYRRHGLKMRTLERIHVIRKHRDFPIFLAVGQR